MDLLWVNDELLVAGPDDSAHRASWAPSRPYVGLRFGAGVGPRVLGLPAREVRNQRIPLSQIWPAAHVRAARDDLLRGCDAAEALERVALRRLSDANPPDPLAAGVVELLGRGTRVDQVAWSVGVSSRQLHRRCLDAFGYGPKTLARILRLQRALDLGRAGRSAAEAAAASGYADQAHMSREVKAMTGVTFGSVITANTAEPQPA
nr:helix-turn-helix domain-containing protein [Phytoactinopolyspora alkaliphila]